MTILYEIKNLSFDYRIEGISFKALDDISLQINKEDFITFAGPSGSGKSTLLNLLGLMEVYSGESILYKKENIGSLNEKRKNQIRRFDIGFIFQSFHLFPVLTTYENIEYFLIKQGIGQKKRNELVLESMEVLGIQDLQNKRPTELSGGQRQRVAIARAIAKRPEVIIADEPTASLDQKNGEAVMDYLKSINKNFSTTIIMASHDPMVLKNSMRKIELKDGKITGGES